MTPEQMEEISFWLEAAEKGTLRDYVRELLSALEEAQQQVEDNKITANELEDQYQMLQRLYRELDKSSGETLDLLRETSRSLVEARKQSDIAYLVYEGLQNDCVSRGEYDSLLNKHSVLARVHREAQQTIRDMSNELSEMTRDRDTWRSNSTY